jgi:hypothetical protein
MHLGAMPMPRTILITALGLALGLAPMALSAAEDGDEAPWGRAESEPRDYQGQRVVYDVAEDGPAGLSGVLDRASYLNKVYGADPFATSIVLVLHGGEIPLFAIENLPQHRELMTRARSLTVGGTIEIRMCGVAAEAHGYQPSDIHGFVQVVPMADAEIVRLQQEQGYVYMQ